MFAPLVLSAMLFHNKDEKLRWKITLCINCEKLWINIWATARLRFKSIKWFSAQRKYFIHWIKCLIILINICPVVSFTSAIKVHLWV